MNKTPPTLEDVGLAALEYIKRRQAWFHAWGHNEQRIPAEREMGVAANALAAVAGAYETEQARIVAEVKEEGASHGQ